MDGDNDIRRSFVVRARPQQKADSTDLTGRFLGVYGAIPPEAARRMTVRFGEIPLKKSGLK